MRLFCANRQNSQSTYRHHRTSNNNATVAPNQRHLCCPHLCQSNAVERHDLQYNVNVNMNAMQLTYCTTTT